MFRSRREIAVASFTFAELCASVARAQRAGRISIAQRDQIIDEAPDVFSTMTVIESRWRIGLRVADLVRTYPLRGYDALQLACCLQVRRGGATELWAADGALIASARAEGLRVVAL